jgi:Peptidase family M23
MAPREAEMEGFRPEALDAKASDEWLALADQVLRSRTERSSCRTNASLTGAVEREPQSPLAPAYRLWIADNFVRDGQLDKALAAYDVAVECAQSAPRLFERLDPIPGALFHKAQAAAATGAVATAIATYTDLGQLMPDDAGPLFHAGELAEERGEGAQAADLYGRVAAASPSRRTDDPAELARRALLRLETPSTDFAPSAERVAELLAVALERRDPSRLQDVVSRTHFAAGPLGGHTAFEPEGVLDELCSDLAVSSIAVRRRLLGSGDKRYLPTRGWSGKWFHGEVVFLITRAPGGWRWTGVGIAAPNELWLERWRPRKKQTNQPLPFPLLAPWPVDQSFTAGGLTEYAVALAGGALAALALARSPCGFGPRGFYYNQWPTHTGSDAFAIDFTRYRRYVPYDNESGGTPVLAARGGIVTYVRAGFPSGYSGDPNVVYVEHAEPGNPKFTSRYLHLEGPWEVLVSEWMPVVTGTRLGRMDDTGNSVLDHLHFSIHDPSGDSVRPTPLNGVRLEDGDSGTCVRSTNIEYPADKPMIEPSSFAGQNWLITPAASAANVAPPTRIEDQSWLLVLSGVAIIDLKGVTALEWRRETVRLQPELSGPLQHAISRYNIPTPPGADGYNFSTWFQVEQWAPFAALSSMLNQHESINSGFAVDLWRPHHFETQRDAFSNATLNRLFTGIQVDVAVRDSDAWIHRLSYNITLLGKIVFSPIIIT